MNLFISLTINKVIRSFFGVLLVLCSFSVWPVEPVTRSHATNDIFDWSKYKQDWMDNIQIHGFLSQALFSSSGNNIYGKSKDSVSAGLTEIGLNASYQALNVLSFSVQGLYRRAGAITGDAGEFHLDYSFADYTFFRHQQGRVGIRGGRIKNPWGLYNETRDVSFTRPTILLPLAYFERSRSLFLSIDGGQLYTDYNTNFGDFSFKFNYGLMDANDPELLKAISFFAQGRLVSDPSFVTQLTYDINASEYLFAISYADAKMHYNSSGGADPVFSGNVDIKSFMLSGQYNGEKFSFTSEYSLQWNEFTQFLGIIPMPNAKPLSQHWYVQAGYRFLDNLQGTLRYGSTIQDISDKSGKKTHSTTGLPSSLMFTQNIVIGLRWDITPVWMLRAEYHRIHGTSTLSLLENPEIQKLVKDWNIYALQMSYRF